MKNKLRVCFIDPSGLDYDIDTPYRRPLGGSKSALCYLAEQLASAGHDVFTFTATSKPGLVRGVHCYRNSEPMAQDFFRSLDAVISLNGDADLLQDGAGGPVNVLWTQHAHDQPQIQFLRMAEEREKWDRFVFISQWQKERYLDTFGIERKKCTILRNAISPAVEHAPSGDPWFKTSRTPTLVYTSTPFRGLDVLLMAFPAIRAAFPAITLEVYSSLSIYGEDEEGPYTVLYDMCRAMEGVQYFGSVAQSELAAALSRASILSYPNTFAETSCISVMEAMAAGCLIITARLGALPETSEGYAILLELSPDRIHYAKNFATTTIDTLQDVANNPEKYRILLDSQVNYARDTLTWAKRAREWADWLRTLVA